MNEGPNNVGNLLEDPTDDGYVFPDEIDAMMSRSRASTKYQPMPTSTSAIWSAGVVTPTERSRASTSYNMMPSYNNFVDNTKRKTDLPASQSAGVKKEVPIVRIEATPLPIKKKKNRCTIS
ncbi:MAG: hypothetical protein BGO43_15455 [Gammaproteobacteria bacterium 39-13]|nr:hypothetical protein [Gammaproteobacteria bacterium]OJV87810.1 MAG: hypothetical protein BGO43_15455 [Gammaproteobacteria bacterium 39-13]